MLRNIDPILSPDLLYTLRSMGHGDEIVIGDRNFPAESLGPDCIRLDGIDAPTVLRAVLSVLPIDTFIDAPLMSMGIVGAPDEIPGPVAEFQQIVNAEADNPAEIALLERFAFYEKASGAVAVIQTGEPRGYANLILTKGVIFG